MRARFLVLGLMLAGLLSATPARAASIGLGTALVTSTETLIPVNIFGVADLLGADVEIVGFDFQALLGSSVLLDVRQGDFFGGADFLGFDVDAVTGTLTVLSTLLGLVPGPITDGVLATLVFATGGTGTSDVLLLNGNVARFIATAEPPFESVPLMIETPPQPIPEPSTLGLLGIGLAALARKRLRRKPGITA